MLTAVPQVLSSSHNLYCFDRAIIYGRSSTGFNTTGTLRTLQHISVFVRQHYDQNELLSIYINFGGHFSFFLCHFFVGDNFIGRDGKCSITIPIKVG